MLENSCILQLFKDIVKEFKLFVHEAPFSPL